MGNFACRCASLGCPDCVDVEPCVWWQLKWRNPGALLRRTGAGAQRQASRRQATSGAAREGGSRAAAYGLLRGVARTSLRRVVGIPGFQLAVWAPVAVRRSGTSIGKGKVGSAFPEVGRVAKQPSSKQSKKEKQQQILTARTPCRRAARRRPDLKPPARRGAHLDRAAATCTAAASRTTVEAPHLLRQRPAARRRRRRGGLMKKHKPSRRHKYVETRLGKQARAQSRSSLKPQALSGRPNHAAARV